MQLKQKYGAEITIHIDPIDIKNPEINNNLQKAMDVYSQVISDTAYTKDKTYKTNKAYVLLNELVNSLNNEDQDIFYVKYKNFMETINEL